MAFTGPSNAVPSTGPFRFAGTPTSGGSGTFVNQAMKGSLLVDTTNGLLYVNTNTLASPTWTLARRITQQATIALLGTTSDLVGVDGTGSNAAPLVGTEARLDAIEAKVDALLTAVIAAGVLAAS